MTVLPVLYSFRRCPYAMRARLAIWQSGLCVELREVELKRKPVEMIEASAKGTVPVLVLPNGEVIDESLDIMHWALTQTAINSWLSDQHADACRLREAWINANDHDFKTHLDHYKYSVGYPEFSAEVYRARGEVFLQQLEEQLVMTTFLSGAQFGFSDAAIAPFVRQFALVDKAWFDQAPYPALRNWLTQFLESDAFQQVMKKYAPWKTATDGVLFGRGVG